MRSIEEIIKALSILQEVCNEIDEDDCYKCPLSNSVNMCMIRDYELSPSGWDIKTDEIWKAFYD
jgi:hypothetical protein